MNSKRERLGIFGGSLNPVHKDHIRIITSVREKFALDEVIIIPNSAPYYKSDCAVSYEDRVAMLKLVVGEGCSISSLESDSSVTHYTYTTVEKLKGMYPEAALFFIMGMDSLIWLEKWKNGLRISDMCNLIVAGRKGYSIEECHPEVKEYLKTHAVYENTAEFEAALSLKKDRCFIINECFNDISSSKIRFEFNEFYRQYGKIADMSVFEAHADKFAYTCEYLDRRVIEYIITHDLYHDRQEQL